MEELNKNNSFNKKNNNKFIIIILISIVTIIALGVIADSMIANNAKNLGKNKDYYEVIGAFDKNEKDNILKKYNLTESEYNDFKELASKVESEIKRNNIASADMYYRKKRDDDLGEAYIVIRGNGTYITIQNDKIETKKYNDTVLILDETVGKYYDEIFLKAKEDTNYNKLIYFDNIEELKEIID